MRVLVQRVSKAQVIIEEGEKREIKEGLLVLLGIEEADDLSDVNWLVKKVINLRVFDDEQGIMNQSLLDIKGALMVVNQFTLIAATKKGNRPSYIRAAKHEHAIPLYELFIKEAEALLGTKVVTGSFGAMMQLHIVNEGPVTIWMDSKQKE